jgi:four helix bundle protein
MRVSRVEDLAVYQKALAAADEVSALLKRLDFSKDFDLKDQLGNSSARLPALIAEGSSRNRIAISHTTCTSPKGQRRRAQRTFTSR